VNRVSLEYLEHKQAEKLAEIKLDGRKNYFMWNGLVCVDGKFTHECSGCDGCGCQECGGHGVRRDSAPIPVNYKQVK